MTIKSRKTVYQQESIPVGCVPSAFEGWEWVYPTPWIPYPQIPYPHPQISYPTKKDLGDTLPVQKEHGTRD